MTLRLRRRAQWQSADNADVGRKGPRMALRLRRRARGRYRERGRKKGAEHLGQRQGREEEEREEGGRKKKKEERIDESCYQCFFHEKRMA